MRRNILSLLIAVVAPASVACVVVPENDSIVGGTSGSCEVGHEGCPCTSGGSCNPGFECDVNQNICKLDTCPVGTEACACTPEGGCDPGLQCASEVCVDASCLPGTAGCPCTEGGGCDPDLVCLSDSCVDDSSLDSSGDTSGCGPGSCEIWECGAEEPACACDCVPGCEDNVATNCGEPAPCVVLTDCEAEGGSCQDAGDEQFECAGADTGTG
ncbi:MAG: hypothetical protein AAF721_13990 [Myxococcota bacterium]